MLHNIIAIPVAVGPNSPFADVCDDLTSFTLQTACDYQGRYIVIHKDGIAAQSRKRRDNFASCEDVSAEAMQPV